VAERHSYKPVEPRTRAVAYAPSTTMLRQTFLCVPFTIIVASAFGPPTSLTTRGSSHAAPPLQMSDVSDLLYQEQEKVLVRRGELEEELTAGTSSPLEASVVKVRGAGKSGGFGGGGGSSTKKTSTAALKAEGKAHAKVLKKDGVVRIDNVLSSDQADKMRDYVLSLRQKSVEEVESGKIPSLRRFADVLLRKDRCDLTMPLGQDDAIVDSLNEVLRESAAGQTIKAILGKGSVLYELSCLISDPGSQRQNIHPDTPYLEGKDAVLYTCFIALQDIRPDMGPTTWLPGTHTAEAHEAFQDSNASGGAESRKDVLIRTNPSVLGLLPKGCCAIFDSRCLHCGTANRSDDDSRALFYFSFKDKNVGYPGNPASIRPEVGAAQLTMEDLEQDLASYSKGKGHPMIDQIGKSLK
jgi:ectoine hydroxylase-related dioxygenase (phytanoyl-CoA dioxygenase family)